MEAGRSDDASTRRERPDRVVAAGASTGAPNLWPQCRQLDTKESWYAPSRKSFRPHQGHLISSRWHENTASEPIETSETAIDNEGTRRALSATTSTTGPQANARQHAFLFYRTSAQTSIDSSTTSHPEAEQNEVGSTAWHGESEHVSGAPPGLCKIHWFLRFFGRGRTRASAAGDQKTASAASYRVARRQQASLGFARDRRHVELDS